MVKTAMSSGHSQPEESEDLAKTKQKLVIQQSLINTSARTLQRLKESTSKFISTSSSSNINGLTNGEAQSAIDDDIRLQENKLMKGFSNQLIEKHKYLKQNGEELDDLTQRELDKLIKLEQFLSISGLQESTTKALLEEDLTLDLLFHMLNPELEQLLAKCSVEQEDTRKLLGALDLLSTYYDLWKKGEKPSVTAANRLGSTSSSRLNSLSNLMALDQPDSRSDSISSSTSAGTSPLPLTTSTPTPLTPSSSQSLLSPSSPFTTALTTPLSFTPSYVMPVLTPPPIPPTSRTQTASPHGLIRSYSSSSNVLLGSETESQPSASRGLSRGHQSVSSLNSSRTPQGPSPSSYGYVSSVGMSSGEASPTKPRKLPLTHKRSLSNPLANIVLDQHAEEGESTLPDSPHNSMHHAITSRSSLACYSYRSPSPPSRTESQPSIVSNNSVSGSPLPQPRSNRHPQMRRISNVAPSFSQSISNDQIMPSASSPNHNDISGSESILTRHSTWQASDGDEYPSVTPRCNSMAGMTRQNYSQSSNHGMDLTSSSMVDLPVRILNGSSCEHLDQVEEGYFSPTSSGKSRSVPRLTLMSVSSDNDRDRVYPSNSNPTSPHTPGSYTPTGHMRHTIMHRFTAKTFITPHECDYCKKKVMIGVRCKDCKYKCHKSCSAKAPPSCGLPQGLMNYFRKHMSMERLADQRVEPAVQSPSERSTPRPIVERSNTYDPDTRDPEFLIQDLACEPTNTHYSPILDPKRSRGESTGMNGFRRELSSQSSSTSLLEVPHPHSRHHYRSTSSSPSMSPPTSPSLTPSSPRSPMEYGHHVPGGYGHYTTHAEIVHTKHHEVDSEDDFYESEGSPYSSEYSSMNDVSDQSRVSAQTPRGLRPGPQVIQAKSLPDLLRISPTETGDLDKSCSRFLEQPQPDSAGEQHEDERPVPPLRPPVGRRVSVESHGSYHHSSARRRESVQRKASNADSKASTLVASVPTEEDDGDSDSYIGSQETGDELGGGDYEYRPARALQHRNSVIDEWSIPFDNIRLGECIQRGRISKVYRSYWHGEVATKHFLMPNASKHQVNSFKEQVAVLKRTRHENLALFMGACLTPPNLAIITIFCRGPTLYKCIHTWSEPFPWEKSIDIAKQIAQAMGYLHARYIVHKNLNTRNIFLESDRNKVVITDTGLSTLSDNFWTDGHNNLVIQHKKLYYLAPELTRHLSPYLTSDEFWQTEETDIYAFGTVLYELMVRKFPFSLDQHGFSIPPEALIYLIGSGCRPEMTTKETPKRMQDLMYDCWHRYPGQRLPFKTIQEALSKMSRKKTPITRSPSFPISLSKSTEGLNFLNP